MRRTAIALMLAVAPGMLAAQSQNQGQSGLTAETQARVDATLRVARAKGLPAEVMTSLVAEGRAKGASETQIVAATQRAEARLEASQQALIAAGHPAPSGQEIAAGAEVLAQGATSAQLTAFARRAPTEQRLDLAFEALSLSSSLTLSGSSSASSGSPSSGSTTQGTPSGPAGSSSGVQVTGQSTSAVGVTAGRTNTGVGLTGVTTGSARVIVRKP